jgi:hypothetical protein
MRTASALRNPRAKGSGFTSRHDDVMMKSSITIRYSGSGTGLAP